MLCDNNQSLLCTDTRYRRGLRDRLWPCRQLHQQRTCRRNGGELRSHDLVPYRECGDAPGWYPASTLAASASRSAAARVAKAPAEEKGGDKEVCGEAPGTNLPGGGLELDLRVLRATRRMWRATDVLGFSAARRSRGGKNSGERYAASPPSRRFLTRPHCVLLPLRLSHAGPHQLGTRLLLWPLFHLFIYYLFCTLRMTQTSTRHVFFHPKFLGQVKTRSHDHL